MRFVTGGAAALVALLRAPDAAPALSLPQWDLLIRQARGANLLARLAVLIDEAGLLAAVPDRPRAHLEAERALAAKQVRDVRWEVTCIERALAETGVPIVLLKGGAYVMADLPPARGRIFADIDIMVPKQRIDDVERALLGAGWFFANTDGYDQRYYRAWMHQLPPLMHFSRGTLVDVHHTIVPETAHAAVGGRALLDATMPLGGSDSLRVLSPADMVLHSVVHLFNEGEFGQGLRDVIDMGDLLSHFGAEPGFWPTLAARSAELGLERPLYYALTHLARLFDPPLPAGAAAIADAGRPPALHGAVMNALLARALRPDHPSCSDALTPFARMALFVRGHALRMPPRLLVPHLLRKAVRGAVGRPARDRDAVHAEPR